MNDSESNEVIKIYTALKEKYNFSKDLLKVQPTQISNQKINDALSNASKSVLKKNKNSIKKPRRGIPDIYYLNEDDNFLFLVEAKRQASYQKIAINEINHYLSFLKHLSPKYKIIGLAISGDIDIEDGHRINTFFINKEKEIKEIKDVRYLQTEKAYIKLFLPPWDDKNNEKINQIAVKINKKLDGIRISTPKRVSLVAGIFIVLHHKEGTTEKKIFKNIYDADLERLDGIIKDNFLTDIKAILEEEFLGGQIQKVNDKIRIINDTIKPIVESENFKGKDNNTLAEVTKYVYEIKQLTSQSNYSGDILANFFQEFLRYWDNDGKKYGIILTPWHVAELMVDLVAFFKGGSIEKKDYSIKEGITKDDICLDPCCGSGTFLLAFMNKQRTIPGVNAEEVKQNLIGVEYEPDIYLLSIASMLIRGDGKANLQNEDFFDEKSKLPKEPTVGLMNPPYSQTKYPEIEFIERLLNKCAGKGYVAVITQSSSLDSEKKNKKGEEFKKNIYKTHTLKAVVKMPNDLFKPTSVLTSIAIFQAKTNHKKEDRVYFYNLKDDGFKMTKNIRQDKFNRWKETRKELFEDLDYLRKNEGDEKNEKAFVTTNLTADDEWRFNYWQQKFQREKNEKARENLETGKIEKGSPLFLTPKEIIFYEEKIKEIISEFILYKIEDKSGILDWKLQINYAKAKGKSKEQEELEKEESKVWWIINNYLLYKWKEKENVLELKTGERISEDFKFLKKLIFSDLEFPQMFINEQQNHELTEKGLNSRRWKKFQVQQIFDREIDNSLLERDVEWEEFNKKANKRIKKTVNYITRNEKNNGIKFCSEGEATCEGNTITVESSAGTGISFYQDKPFVTDGKIHKLKLKNKVSLNIYRGLFLNSILRLNMKYYDRGYLRDKDKLNQEWILLPVNDQGEPDWGFMDIYIYIARDWLRKQGYKENYRDQEVISYHHQWRI